MEPDSVELGQLVQEQHAVVGEGDLARPGDVAAADQGHAGGGVVRGPEGPRAPEVRVEPARADRLDRGRLHGLVLGHRREDPRQAGGQHGLAGAWGPYEKEVMVSGRGDLERPLRVELTQDVGEVAPGGRPLGARRAPGRRQSRRAVQVGAHLQDVTGPVDDGALGQAGLGRVGPGDQEAVPGAAGLQRGRKHAPHGPQLTREGELSDELTPGQGCGGDLSGCSEDAERDGQVEPSALLGAVLALPDRRLGQADDGEAGQPVGEVHLHGHRGCFHADLGARPDDGEAHGVPP